MSEKELSVSELFGQNEALFAYKMARSFDGDSDVPDTPIQELARSAVLTALRIDRDENGSDPSRIDVEVDASTLSEALELEAIGSITTL